MAAAALGLVTACVSRGPVLTTHLDAGAPQSVELSDTPFFPQTDYHCGPAALATVLSDAGRDVDMDTLVSQVYVPGKQGSFQIEITAAARRHGRLPYPIAPTLAALLAELRAGRPVLVFQNLGVRFLPVWHYAVVVGFDAGADTIVLRSGAERRRVLAAGEFLATWERAGRWALVVLAPGEMPVRPDRDRYLSAAAAMAAVNPPAVSARLMHAAVAQWPRDALARFALGNALYEQDMKREALSAYRRAVDLDPALLVARNNLAHLLAELGCRDRALDEIEWALAHGGDADQSLARTLRQTHAEIRRMEPGAGAGAACREASTRFIEHRQASCGSWRAQEDSNL